MGNWPGEGPCRAIAHRMAHARRGRAVSKEEIRKELAELDESTAQEVRYWLGKWGVHAL